MPSYICFTEKDDIVIKRDRVGNQNFFLGRNPGKDIIKVTARSKEKAYLTAKSLFGQIEQYKLEEKGSTIVASTEIETKDG